MKNIEGKKESERKEKSVESVSEDFVLVEGGTFSMGSNKGIDDEKPVHNVTVSSFYMCRHEVTQKEYEKIMKDNPSYFKGDNRPVEKVSWYDAVEYCNALSSSQGLDPCYKINKYITDPNKTSVYDEEKWTVTCDFNANGYRLPTEAEWEFAAGGGNSSENYEYSGSNDIGSVAWYYRNCGDTTHDVMTKKPNELGLYDMSGNVFEWCWDWYGIYSSNSQTNPFGASSGSKRVNRGGSWSLIASCCRVASRSLGSPGGAYGFLGFRVVRSSSR